MPQSLGGAVSLASRPSGKIRRHQEPRSMWWLPGCASPLPSATSCQQPPNTHPAQDVAISPKVSREE